MPVIAKNPWPAFTSRMTRAAAMIRIRIPTTDAPITCAPRNPSAMKMTATTLKKSVGWKRSRTRAMIAMRMKRPSTVGSLRNLRNRSYSGSSNGVTGTPSKPTFVRKSLRLWAIPVTRPIAAASDPEKAVLFWAMSIAAVTLYPCAWASDVMRAARMFDRIECDRRGIRSGIVLDQFESDRLGVFLELLDRPRTECIRRGDDTRVAFLHDMVRELRDRRRLAGPVHADEHHDEGTGALLDQAEEVEGRHGQRLRDRVPEGHLDALFEAHLPRDPLPPEVLREAVHDLLGDRESHVGLEEGDLEVVQDLLELVFLDLAAGVADRLRRYLGFGLLFPAGEPLSERLEHLAPLARCVRSLQPVVQVLDRGAVGLRPPLQVAKALSDRIGRLGDRFDPGVEPFDLSVHLIVHQEIGADRDERLVDVFRLCRQERIRADRHEDFRRLPGFAIPHEGLAGPHVLLEGDADDLLLLRQRFDLRPVLIEDRDSPPKLGLAGAHARASSAYRTA